MNLKVLQFLVLCVTMISRVSFGQVPPQAENIYPTADELSAITPGAWTLVVFPDTQYYVDHTRVIPPTPEIFESMVDWSLRHREARNIGLVLHVGDIVDNNTAEEWKMARGIWSKFDGLLPYAFTTGNHEYTGNSEVRETALNDYFRPTDNPLNDPARGGILVETMEAGRMENAVYRFRAPDGRQLLILALEWGARDHVVDWANTVLSRPVYANDTAILLIHACLYHDNTLYDWDARGQSQSGNPHSYGTARSGDTNDGRQLWEKLVRRHPQFQLVLCGHVSGTEADRFYLGDQSEVGYLACLGDSGQTVHHLLFNAQRRGDSGEGWLRLLEFQSDGKTVFVKTFSPWKEQRKLAAWRSDPDDYFQIELSTVARTAAE